MNKREIPPGAKLIKPSDAMARYGRQKSWFWDRVKNDPQFPKPIYLGSHPVFLDCDIDEHIAKLVGAILADSK